jgi:hypothetical protein
VSKSVTRNRHGTLLVRIEVMVSCSCFVMRVRGSLRPILSHQVRLSQPPHVFPHSPSVHPSSWTFRGKRQIADHLRRMLDLTIP